MQRKSRNLRIVFNILIFYFDLYEIHHCQEEDKRLKALPPAQRALAIAKTDCARFISECDKDIKRCNSAEALFVDEQTKWRAAKAKNKWMPSDRLTKAEVAYNELKVSEA